MRNGFGRALGLLATIAVVSPCETVAARLQGTRQNPLTSITGLRCRFSATTTVVWKDGKPDVRTESTDSRFTITDIDIEDGTAEVVGPQGRRFATTVLSDGSLYFTESTRGALEVTSVFASQSAPGKFKAVRAVQAYVFLTVPPFVPDPTVSQSVGECEPTPSE
jgi:hypothetical protein